jgi:hypothetical protein
MRLAMLIARLVTKNITSSSMLLKRAVALNVSQCVVAKATATKATLVGARLAGGCVPAHRIATAGPKL